MKDNSSLGSYVARHGMKSSINSAFIEQMINTELQSSILKIGEILPILPSIMAPVIGVEYQLQSSTNDINMAVVYRYKCSHKRYAYRR